MPRLARLRYVSIGHRDARMDDLLLDFRGKDGRAADSIVWLRNGGGKSSLLNLFFSMMRPSLRDFLGAKADGKRSLLDYVQRDDRAVVAAEWELDGRGGLFDARDGPERYLTGVFYERGAAAAAGAGDLNRFYFAARVLPSTEALTLDALPLYTRGSDGREVRRNLAAFRQEWRALQAEHPQAEVGWASQQNEWEKLLDQAGLDPALFAYQLVMNQREGGADDLFKFRETDEFVDFFLEMILDPAEGDDVARNIEAYRDRLAELATRLKPEQALLEELVRLTEPLVALAAERRRVREEAGMARAAADGLRLHLVEQARTRDAEAAAEAALQHEAEQEAREMTRLADLARRNAAGLRHLAARVRLQAAEREAQELKIRYQATERERHLWSAAVPLREALRHKRVADDALAALEQGRQEQAPLLQQLRDAAARLYAALHRRAQRLRDEVAALDDQVRARRASAQEHLGLAARADSEAVTAEQKALALEAELAREQREWRQLAADGTVGEDEFPAAALPRLRAAADAERNAMNTARAELSRVQNQVREAAAQEAEIRVEIGRRETEQRERRQRLEHAAAEREALEAHPLLREQLELEQVDADRMDAASTDQILRGAAAAVSDRSLDLRAALAEHERALAYLEAHRRLPPSRDVETVLRVLRDARRTAWSGWEYMARAVAVDERDEFVRRRPALAAGVIVPDTEIEACADVLRAAELPLDGVVVVAPQRAAVRDAELEGVVCGPGSTALYDEESGNRERVTREHRRDRDQDTHDEARATEQALRSLAETVRAFRGRYPHGWFAAQAEEAERERRALEGLADARAAVQKELEQLARVSAEAEHTVGSSTRSASLAERRLERVQDHLGRWGTDRAQREVNAAVLRQDAGQAHGRAAAHRNSAADAAEQADQLDREGRQAAEKAADTEGKLGGIRYVDATEPLPPSAAEDTGALLDEYDHLRQRYETAVGEAGLMERYRYALQLHDEARKRMQARAQAGSVDEGEVASVLGALPDPDEVESRAQLADMESRSIFGSLGRKQQDVGAAEKELRSADDECQRLGGVPLLSTELTPDEADRAAAAADVEAGTSEMAASAAAQRAQAARERWHELKQAQERAGSNLQLLDALTSGHEAILQDVLPPATHAGWTPPAEEEIAASLQALKERLARLKREHDQLNTRRGRIAQQMNDCMGDPRFEHLRSGLAQRLKRFSADDLEARAEQVRDDLALRFATVQDEIEKLEKHRSALAVQLLSAAERGLRALGAASRRSRLPETVRGLGGMDFLKISTGEPEESSQRQERISSLLDEFANGTAVPRGLALVQQAVRRIGKPIQVKVLLPKPTKQPEWKPITEMARQSGGERLTSAILLYCTLAQLRASQRGQRLRPSGTLLLDNPIGAASWEPLLELQREVARAMGIQLIYATGIDSLGAVRMMPVVLRLKNDRRDRWSGESVVELDGGNSQLDVAHLRLEDRPATGGDGVREAVQERLLPEQATGGPG